MYRWTVFICILFLSLGAARAQKKKPIEQQPTSIDPSYAEEHYVPKATKGRKSFEPTYEARNKYKDRMNKNWRQREKDEKNFKGDRKADKSQPPYFGHKRPPKIHPPGKQKFCKVCGIKH
ncbi:MAG: hypothetical protein KF860_06155, partial [Cyclobacteriaceae bacterium]|nr:hypothetical protein [Cyclobacteriaceae bacterium]